MSQQTRQATASTPPPAAPRETSLKRSLTLTNAVLYGLGVTIGAGIYVLVGAAAGRAGMHAPLAFAAAGVLMGLTAASFAELVGRMPVAAGEAAYVRAAFQSDRLATLVGLLVIAIAIVSAAAISIGSAGYVGVFLPLPQPLLVGGVVVAMAAVAAWGIKESVVFAGVMTVIEVGGLILLIAAGIGDAEIATRLPEMVPAPGSFAALAGIAGASLLAVFAFVGFDSIVNIAEEVHEPKRTLPRAIFLTLALATVLYMLVVWVAVVAVPPAELAASQAPLALVFERLTGASPRTMSLIAVIATLNGIIVQLILAARVLYGLGTQGNLPAWLREVSPVTRTPLNATLLSALIVLLLALLLPLERLADWTSRITLVMFAFVNLALARIKARDGAAPDTIYTVPQWVPWAGCASCLALVAIDFLLVLTARTP
jgi:amino acid transporter